MSNAPPAEAAAGLSNEEAVRRLEQHGANELQRVRSLSAWSILAAQLDNVLVLILLAAAGLSGLLGHAIEASVIAAIVLFALLLGFLQEYRAERSLEALEQMAAPFARVVRDGRERSIASREVVPGDLVVLRAGDRVPADARITAAPNLAVDESALTGESTPVEKSAGASDDPSLPLGDRRGMVFAGTLVTAGRGRATVVATGMGSELGKISRLVQQVQAGRTPLQRDLDRLGGVLGKVALIVALSIAALGIWRGQPALEMLLLGIALAVAAVPEALPAVVTISLAVGVRRMVRRNALVRRLPVVETLGSTSVICCDKTGTMTRDEMTLRELVAAGRHLTVTGVGYEPTGEFVENGEKTDVGAAGRELLEAFVLASDARVRQAETWHVEGDPTEGALVVAAAKAGLHREALEKWRPRVDELAFTPERRRMTTLHRREDGTTIAYCKGATEAVLERCSKRLTEGGDVPLDPAARQSILTLESELASRGLRVLAAARAADVALPFGEEAMTFLGLAGLMDPPRTEVRAAVATCGAAGITTVMITGDHPATATAVATELGLLDGRRVVTGPELERLGDEDLARQVAEIGVYARVSPADKLRVVTAWQERGEVVAMTGDGVNDAPALKKADVGIAMGITGTDVSKEAAAITLLDDNFASIVAAVEEGRIVFANIRKYLVYLLSSNAGEILLMAGAALLGLPLPLLAVQVLYVNLASDGLPALALAVDPPAGDLMRQRPRDLRAGVLTRHLVFLLLAGGLWTGAVTLSLFGWLLHGDRPPAEAMAVTFASLVLMQLVYAFCCRSERDSILQRPFANRWLNLAVLWELGLLGLVIYVPFFQEAFGTFALGWADWGVVATTALSIVPWVEAVKWSQRRDPASHPTGQVARARACS